MKYGLNEGASPIIFSTLLLSSALEHIQARQFVHRFGREGNQIAIFSLKGGREIMTEGTGESTEARLRRLEQDDRITLGSGADNE